MSVQTIIFLILLIFSFGFLFYNIRKIISYLKLGQAENRFDNPSKRVIHTLKVAFAQSKILREKKAGLIHIAIFWGFLVLLFSASETVFQGIFGTFSWDFLGPIYTLITFSTDIFCVAIIIAIISAFYRRFITKVKRLQGDKDEVKDAVIVLSTIFLIVISLLLQNASLSVIDPLEEWAFRPISDFIGDFIGIYTAIKIYEICWWAHIIFILAFANYLPYSKHFHVYASIPNVYFSSLTPVNKLQKIDFEQEGVEKFGVCDINDLSWKAILDSYSCTHCGRCTNVCPANLTGKELSPREIIVQIRQRTSEVAPIMLLEKRVKSTNNSEQENTEGNILSEAQSQIKDKKFVGEYENIDAIWQCTTCGACMQECPVTIEHVPDIVGMRRSLVMMEANFPTLLQNAFSNLETNATPWAFSPSERADWAEGKGIKIAADYPEFDVLFWVGCAGSFDDRAKKVSIAFSKLMQIADVDFAILGTEEQCNGDVARRAGNEYLADMLIKANVETLSRYKFNKIVTFCPHCYNTLKNEYPEFGAKYEVLHHSEFLKELIAEGKLKLNENNSTKHITYHDSCYLGRYNNIFDAPRNVLTSIPGVKLHEAERNRDKGLCCGAGGGQMFMEETVGKRINIERTEDLLVHPSDTIALNCPFCMTMITDGIKAKEKIDDIQVKDISEILLENLAV